MIYVIIIKNDDDGTYYSQKDGFHWVYSQEEAYTFKSVKQAESKMKALGLIHISKPSIVEV